MNKERTGIRLGTGRVLLEQTKSQRGVNWVLDSTNGSSCFTRGIEAVIAKQIKTSGGKFAAGSKVETPGRMLANL